MYLINSSGEIKSQGEIRKLHSNKSLPKVWDASVCELLGITPIMETPKPTTTDLTKQYVRNGTEVDALGNTVQAWVLVDKFTDTEEATKLEQEQAYLETLKTQKRESVKQTRKQKTEATCTVTIDTASYTFDCDAAARSAIHQSIDNSELAGLTDADTITWKLATGEFRQFTLAELKQAALQIAMFIQAQYTNEAILNAQIDAATLADIENITWE